MNNYFKSTKEFRRINEAKSYISAYNAIEDLFNSTIYNGIVPNYMIEKTFNSDKWKIIYGSKAIEKAWNKMIEKGEIKNDQVEGTDVWIRQIG